MEAAFTVEPATARTARFCALAFDGATDTRREK
jgi:hypothetical protein